MHDRTIRRMMCTILLLFAVTSAQANDFAIAEQAFAQGHYTIAEVYFKSVLADRAYRAYAPDAAFYLTRIYEEKNEFLSYVDAVNVFLATYDFDERCPQLMDDLLERLCVQKSFRLAFEYALRYDYLVGDGQTLCRIGHGLFEQHDTTWAAQAFSRCPVDDTVRILQAALSGDPEEKQHFYDHVQGSKGVMYTIELLLETGDTIGAYDAYRSTDGSMSDPGLLYRYAKASLLFDIARMDAAINTLRKFPKYEKKCGYLEALAREHAGELALPDDVEEGRLFIACLSQKTLDRALPEGIVLDSIVPDTVGIEGFAAARQAFPGVFLFDSLYSEALLREGRVREAFDAVKAYLGYAQTYHYVRFVRGLERYGQKDYSGAVLNTLLSQNRGPRAQYVLARASAFLGRDPLEHYEALLSARLDSSFRVQAQQEVITHYYQQEMYAEIVALPYDIAIGNDTLHRYYLYSMARTGSVQTADSLALAAFGSIDDEQTDLYGAYLIANKAYKTARHLYDSLWTGAPESLTPAIQYTWALVPMLQGDIDTALARFKNIIGNLPPGRPYYLSMFKSATIHFLKDEFDSAAFYYGEASKDDSLKVDALRNQLICCKKGAEWRSAIEVAGKLLPLLDDEDAAEVYFEYGYAQLRYGDSRNAILHFQQALQRVSTPEYHFWLGETYLAKGDFPRALYQYRKIMNLFPKDEMWTPTAWYKIGIALEFMEEFSEARKIYEDIIKRRGAADTWGVEAQKRLDQLK